VNQPEALDRVKALQQQLAALLEAIEESQAVTASEDRSMVRASYGLWLAILAAMVLIAFAIQH
jgi:ferric-dicitrate binding protein FerR (iron transport regulator)